MENPSVAVNERHLPDLIRRLRSLADQAEPQWRSICFIVQQEDDGGAITTIDDLVGPQGLRSEWLGSARRDVVTAAQEWLRELQTAGGKLWYSVVIGIERESGNFDAIFVNFGPGADQWEITTTKVDQVMARAWRELNVEPKP